MTRTIYEEIIHYKTSDIACDPFSADKILKIIILLKARI